MMKTSIKGHSTTLRLFENRTGNSNATVITNLKLFSKFKRLLASISLSLDPLLAETVASPLAF
jgi:hypothetical protein